LSGGGVEEESDGKFHVGLLFSCGVRNPDNRQGRKPQATAFR
jgi:hypothetical protein